MAEALWRACSCGLRTMYFLWESKWRARVFTSARTHGLNQTGLPFKVCAFRLSVKKHRHGQDMCPWQSPLNAFQLLKGTLMGIISFKENTIQRLRARPCSSPVKAQTGPDWSDPPRADDWWAASQLPGTANPELYRDTFLLHSTLAPKGALLAASEKVYMDKKEERF